MYGHLVHVIPPVAYAVRVYGHHGCHEALPTLPCPTCTTEGRGAGLYTMLRTKAGLKTRSNKARKRHKKRCDFDVYFNFIRTDCIYTVQQKGKPEHKVSLY